MEEGRLMEQVQVPHSREEEEVLIGAININPEAMFEVQDIVDASDFYIHRNRWIWEALVSIYNRDEPIDIVTLVDEIDKTGRLEEIGGMSYLLKLTNNVPSSLHAVAYAKRVKETSVRRKLLAGSNQQAKDAYDETKTINEIVADSIRDLDKLSTVTDAGKLLVKIVSDVADIIMERIDMRARGEKVEVGFQTGIPYIDRNFLGWKKGWLVYWAGSPNVGKTKAATQVSAYLASQAPGCYIAFEGDEQSTAFRLLEGKLGVSATDIEYGKVDATKLMEAIGEFDTLSYDFFYAPRLSVQELRAYISKQKAEKGIGWVVIDYVSLLTVPGIIDKNEKDVAMSAELRRITGEFNILTIGLDSIIKSGANKILSLEDIEGRFSKQHDSDITLGYSDYKTINGLAPELDDFERKRNCRLLGVLKDRHRNNKGKIMPLELVNGRVVDFKEEDNGYIPHWSEDK